MICLLFLHLVAKVLGSHLSKNLNAHSRYDIKQYGCIAYSRRPPPPAIYFQTSADYADEYHLGSYSLANLTITRPSSLYLNSTDSSGNPADGNTSFFRLSSLPRLCSDILHGLVQTALWIVSTAIEILVAALQVVLAMGPPAAAAYALREQKSRELLNFEMKSVSNLVPFWNLTASMVDNQSRFIADLRAQLKSSTEKIEFQEARLVQTIQDSCEREKASKDAIWKHEVTIAHLHDRMKRREDELNAQQQESFANHARYEVEIARFREKTETTITEAVNRCNTAQNLAEERIRKLEESLDAEQKSGQEAMENAESDMKVARECIESLLLIRSSSQESKAYTEEAIAQRHAGPYAI